MSPNRRHRRAVLQARPAKDDATWRRVLASACPTHHARPGQPCRPDGYLCGTRVEGATHGP